MRLVLVRVLVLQKTRAGNFGSVKQIGAEGTGQPVRVQVLSRADLAFGGVTFAAARHQDTQSKVNRERCTRGAASCPNWYVRIV